MFIGLWAELLQPGQGPESVARFSEQIREVSHLLVLHGSSEVVRAHKAMQDLSLQEARVEFGDSLLRIRKDLGLESDSLPAQDLAHLLSTGPENRRPLRVRRPPG